MTNKEEIYDLVQSHPEGLDDDDISKLTGIEPRQQVQNLCTQLVEARRIRRESVCKPGKRRKIHNFPIVSVDSQQQPEAEPVKAELWRRRLAALIAATGRSESDLLDEALQALALKILQEKMR
jgi:hypothetical protein